MWAEKYLGEKWTEDSHCLDFVVSVLAREKGITLTLPGAGNHVDISNAVYGSRKELAIEVTDIQDYDVALFRPVGGIFHIGVVAISDQSYILHCRRNTGAVCEPLNRCKRLIQGFYRVQNA